jgi:hypothetical protein
LYYEGYEAMKEIEESKQDMSDNVPGPHQRTRLGGMRKSMWCRSGRERKPFSFVV